MKYIKNGKYILPDGILENVVLAYDNKICGFTTEEEIPANAEVIDANGGYVAPVLWIFIFTAIWVRIPPTVRQMVLKQWLTAL